MQPDGAPSGTAGAETPLSGVAIEDIVGIREQSLFDKLVSTQAFWVTVALVFIIGVMCFLQPEAFASRANFYNITRNFAFIGIMAVGMVAVIVTGGIDLSVGSIMGLVGVVCGLLLPAGYPWWLVIVLALLSGAAIGLINGLLIAYVGLSPFVVTLGMLSFARSLAIVLSENKILYEFGPSGPTFKVIGGGQMLGLSNPVWVLIVMTALVAIVLKTTTWGRHLYSIGGNEQAARLTGVPVDRVKVQAYVISALCASIAAVLIVGWQGSAINALGTGYELRVIASTVIGGANLMGGEGGAYGAFVGAALLEVIRNSLLMQGIDSNWQGAFVGVFIVLAVLLEKIRGRRRA